MSKVFVVQENNRIDYSDAERFGEVVFLTAEEYKAVKNSIRNQSMIAEIERKVEEFNPTTDFLLLTGDPMTIGYVFHLVMKKAATVNCLKWERFNNAYRVVSFTRPH